MCGRFFPFLRGRRVRSFRQKFLDKVRGNDDSLIFEQQAEFFWRIAFFEGFSEIAFQKLGRFRSGFSIFPFGQIMEQFFGSRELFRAYFCFCSHVFASFEKIELNINEKIFFVYFRHSAIRVRRGRMEVV